MSFLMLIHHANFDKTKVKLDMVIKYDQAMTFFLGVSVFFFLKPFFLWGDSLVFTVIPVFLYFSFFLFCKKERPKYRDIVFFIVLLMISLLVVIPFREYDGFHLYFVLVFAVVMSLFWVPAIALARASSIFINLIFMVSVVNLISFSLHLVGAPVGGLIIDNDARSDTYYLSYGSLVLNSQFTSVMGVSVYRSVGWFMEPGHFGIYLALALAMMDKPFSKLKSWPLLISLLVTFSAASYVALIMIIVFKYKGAVYRVLLPAGVALVVLGYMLSGGVKEVIDERFLYKLSQEEGTLEARARFDGSELNLSTKTLVGFGSTYLSEKGWILSDYRGVVYKYGYTLLGLIVLFLGYGFFVHFKAGLSDVYVMFIILALVLLHRSWMSYEGCYWFCAVAVYRSHQYLFPSSVKETLHKSAICLSPRLRV